MIHQIILFLAITALAAPICVEVEPSFLAQATDCTISKLDQNTISWTAKLTFLSDVDHRQNNWFNLLADMEHPRLPYFPVGSQCTSTYGKFYSGQSVELSCTQSFDAVPRDYVNAVYILQDSVSPYGFSMKVPVGIIESEAK